MEKRFSWKTKAYFAQMVFKTAVAAVTSENKNGWNSTNKKALIETKT